jgi:hypothetical protein
MGLFSRKVTTTVSSSVYNLAGDDESLRPEFLKMVVLGHVLGERRSSIGNSITQAIQNGNGVRQRRFYRWCRDNYVYGLPNATLDNSQKVASTDVIAGMAALLSLNTNQELVVSSALIDDAELDYWAEDYMRVHRSDLTEDDWVADFDPLSSEIVFSIADEDELRVPGPADMLWGFNVRGRRILYLSYYVLTQDLETLDVAQSDIEMFTYRMGSGNASFDTINTAQIALDSFFPVVPLRLNNVSIRHGGYEAHFENIAKAYSKLTGSSFDELLDSVEANESLGDIDYCFMVQGVSLNSQDKASMAYLYAFFQDMMAKQSTNAQDYANFQTQIEAQLRSVIELERWQNANNANNSGSHLSFFGTPPPITQVQPVVLPSTNELRVHSNALSEFDYRIRWRYVNETQHVGNGKAYDGNQTRGLMPVGSHWVTVGPSTSYTTRELQRYNNTIDRFDNTQMVTVTHNDSRVYIFKQHSAYAYSRIEVVGLQHRNFIYQGHKVDILAADALADPDPSGFLIPLHYPTLKSIGLLKGTDLSSTSSYLVFNSYLVTKQKWYQTGIFKIILVIASIAIAVVSGGASLGATTGLLGTNAAVGAAIGITGTSAAALTAAAVAGAAVNAIAGMILSQLITKASVAIFGEKFGAIIGTLVSFVAFTYGIQYAETGNFDVDWSSLMRAENIIKITNSMSSAYAQWLNVDTNEIYANMAKLEEEYVDDMAEVAKMADEILGMTSGLIDPMMFTDTETDEHLGESSSTFINRTLLTGSDIAELTHVMIERMPEITLELPSALR